MLDIRLAVDEQDGNPDPGSGDDRTDVVNRKVALTFGELKCPGSQRRRKEERGPLRRDSTKIGEGLRRHYGTDPRINRRPLKRHGGTQGRSQQDNRAALNGIEPL